MHGPNSETSLMPGFYLEVTAPNRIVLTNAFTTGWVAQAPFMVGVFDFGSVSAGGTHYHAAAR